MPVFKFSLREISGRTYPGDSIMIRIFFYWEPSFVCIQHRHIPSDIPLQDISPSLFTWCRTFPPSTTITHQSIKRPTVNVYKIDSGRSVRVRVRNTGACMVSGVRRSEPIAQVLEDLHWLPVSERVVFKTALMVWKCVYGVAPAYLGDLCVYPLLPYPWSSASAICSD